MSLQLIRRRETALPCPLYLISNLVASELILPEIRTRQCRVPTIKSGRETALPCPRLSFRCSRNDLSLKNFYLVSRQLAKLLLKLILIHVDRSLPILNLQRHIGRQTRAVPNILLTLAAAKIHRFRVNFRSR